jgi:hypothetical protein
MLHDVMSGLGHFTSEITVKGFLDTETISMYVRELNCSKYTCVEQVVYLYLGSAWFESQSRHLLY